MKDKIKIAGKTSLARDLASKAIINTSESEYKKAVTGRKKRLEDQRKVENLEKRLTTIENLLSKIIDKMDKN